MGFLSKTISATIKLALIPVAIVKDVTNLILDEEVNTAEKILESATEDLSDAIDDLFEDNK